MTASIFVDTNVLIYALDEAAPKKLQAARARRGVVEESSGPDQLSGSVGALREGHTAVAKCAGGGSQRSARPSGMAAP